MSFLTKIFKRNTDLDIEFAGEYIIELFHKVKVEDDIHPYYYLAKEFFLVKEAGNLSTLKQLTGENAGQIITETTVKPSVKGSTYFQVTANDFMSLVNTEKYIYERFTRRELTEMTKKYNARQQELARQEFKTLHKDYYVVQNEFPQEEVEDENSCAVVDEASSKPSPINATIA